MILQAPRPLTLDAAQALHRLHRAPLGPGLSERELDVVEERFGFRFAADHRMFLRAGLPLGGGWPDWRNLEDDGALRKSLDWPVEGTLFDVGHNGFWHPAWGERPERAEEAVRIAEAALAEVPQLVPVRGHRYLPGVAGQFGHPVLSVYQTDIIVYGSDLGGYLRHEFNREPVHYASALATVPFWSYVLAENNGFSTTGIHTTRYDPYARSAAEAVTDLRMLALERVLGRHVGAEQLAGAARTALALGVDSPALQRLASPDHAEGSAVAGALLDQAVDGLGLTAGLPTERTGIRWELARWWLTLIAEGGIDPAAGAGLVAREAWSPLGHPEALRPIADAAVQHDAWHGESADSRETIGARARAEATRLLAGPWPPLS